MLMLPLLHYVLKTNIKNLIMILDLEQSNVIFHISKVPKYHAYCYKL